MRRRVGKTRKTVLVVLSSNPVGSGCIHDANATAIMDCAIIL